MRYIEPSFSEIKESDPFKKIAYVAHNCYQVEKIGQEKEFVMRILSFKHLAMVEHYMLAAEISKELYERLIGFHNRFIILAREGGLFYASFSLRPLLDQKDVKNTPLSGLIVLLPDELKNLFDIGGLDLKREGKILSEEEIDKLPITIYEKIKNVTVRIVTDRGVTHEIVRHRLASYAQESTRYCNYANDKFGKELTFIKPLDYNKFSEIYDRSFSQSEKNYFELLENGSSPEMARGVLPSKLKATIIMTADIEEWKVFFALRCDSRAHPDMRQISIPMQEYFRKEGYIR